MYLPNCHFEEENSEVIARSLKPYGLSSSSSSSSYHRV